MSTQQYSDKELAILLPVYEIGAYMLPLVPVSMPGSTPSKDEV